MDTKYEPNLGIEIRNQTNVRRLPGNNHIERERDRNIYEFHENKEQEEDTIDIPPY